MDNLIYTTREGDTWDTIALGMYNDEYKADLLMDCNPALCGYVTFPAGKTMTVPLITLDAATPDTMPPWKRGG